MTRYLFLLGVLLLSFTAVSAQDDVVKKELAKLQGTWVVVSAEFNGKSVESSKGDTFTFEGNKAKIKNKVKETEPMTIKLDPAKKPKEIDFQDGSQGIYRLEGDALTLFYGGKRPSGFDAKEGLLLKLKRAKS